MNTKSFLLLAAVAPAVSAPLAAQVPVGATPIQIKQVNTLSGVTTWTFNDSAGKLYYIQSAAYIMIQVPGGPSAVTLIPAPGLWSVTPTPPPVPPPTSTPSPDLTAITDGKGTITDATGGRWTILGGQVLLNGTAVGYTSGVVKLITVKGTMWQQNSVGNWYYWNPLAAAWDGGAAPI